MFGLSAVASKQLDLGIIIFSHHLTRPCTPLFCCLWIHDLPALLSWCWQTLLGGLSGGTFYGVLTKREVVCKASMFYHPLSKAFDGE
jgi:hypothetical protein